MKLLEFITYCQLKGYVTGHREVVMAGWDVDAEKYMLINLKGRAYTAKIRYAVIGEGAAVVECALHDHAHKFADGRRGTNSFICPELRDIIAAFVPEKTHVLKDDAT